MISKLTGLAVAARCAGLDTGCSVLCMKDDRPSERKKKELLEANPLTPPPESGRVITARPVESTLEA